MTYIFIHHDVYVFEEKIIFIIMDQFNKIYILNMIYERVITSFFKNAITWVG